MNCSSCNEVINTYYTILSDDDSLDGLNFCKECYLQFYNDEKNLKIQLKEIKEYTKFTRFEIMEI